MPKQRQIHSPEFKVKVAVDAIRGLKTASELASHYQVHPVQISQWKKQALEGLGEVFQRGQAHRKTPSPNELTAPLYDNGVRLIRPGYHRHDSPQPSGQADSPPTGNFTFFRPG